VRNILGKRGHPARARGATSWTGARPLRRHAARRVYVLVFICIGSQRIECVACDDVARFLIHHLDAKFSRAFDAIFNGEGMRSAGLRSRRRTGTQIERWVGSVRQGALTGCSSSAATSSSVSSASMCGTTSSAHTAHSIYNRPTVAR
jgi:hypothetical protein